jgi:hypothetical protein
MPKERKPIPFVILDSTVLTNGIRVLVSGVDIEQFQKNAVLLFDHNDWSLPIGRVDNVRKEADQILGDVVFDYEDLDKDAQRIIGKVERGFMRACSPGLVDLEGTDDELYRLNGQDNVTITKCRLREVSIVAIGKNHNALRLYDKDGAEIQYVENPRLLLSDFIVSPKINVEMKINLSKLNLSDGATDDQINQAIDLLLSDKKKVEDDLVAEKLKTTAHETEKQNALKAEALNLTDAAIRDGRLDAKAKDSVLNLFDKDPEAAKTMLENITKPTSIQTALNAGDKTERQKLEAMSWDEMDKKGLLLNCKDTQKDLYVSKFKEKFGKEPAS